MSFLGKTEAKTEPKSEVKAEPKTHDDPPYIPTHDDLDNVSAAQNAAANRAILERLCSVYPFLQSLVDDNGGIDAVVKPPEHKASAAKTKTEEHFSKRR